ncbi:MAG: hypothetical protein ACLUNS_10440 [Alistipes shahii]
MATVTGVTRQLNNRHWMSDMMVGAGIGILATELGLFPRRPDFQRQRAASSAETLLRSTTATAAPRFWASVSG